jgi:hypothetical protein
MMLMAPVWLLGLIPWSALTVWTLLGRPQLQGVPFLPLWASSSAHHATARAWQRPPLAVLLLLFALLLSLLAATRPVMPGKPFAKVTVILDRGLSMSAMSDRRVRFVIAAEMAAARLSPGTQVELVDLLSGDRHTLDAHHFASQVATLPRTAIETRPLARSTVLDELARSTAPVWILSDQVLDLSDPRLWQIRPGAPIENVGIVQLSATATPSAQVMVEIINNSAQTRAELQIHSDGAVMTSFIDLPPRHQTKRYFIDLDHLGDKIQASLRVADDLDADNTAWLVREGTSPRLEVRGVVPPALRRMIAIYAKSRPPPSGAAIVAIVQDQASLSAAEAGVIVAPPIDTSHLLGAVRVAAHPLTSIVNWPEAVRTASVAGPSPAAWEPLVTAGEHVLVAARSTPVRRLWIGLESTAWERSPDYVVFWSNAFTWLAGLKQDFSFHAVTQLDPQWTCESPLPAGVQPSAWPGIYRRSDGVLRAMNVQASIQDISKHSLTSAATDPPAIATAHHPLAPWLGIAALCFVLLSALSWRCTSSARPFPVTASGHSP